VQVDGHLVQQKGVVVTVAGGVTKAVIAAVPGVTPNAFAPADRARNLSAAESAVSRSSRVLILGRLSLGLH